MLTCKEIPTIWRSILSLSSWSGSPRREQEIA